MSSYDSCQDIYIVLCGHVACLPLSVTVRVYTLCRLSNQSVSGLIMTLLSICPHLSHPHMIRVCQGIHLACVKDMQHVLHCLCLVRVYTVCRPSSHWLSPSVSGSITTVTTLCLICPRIHRTLLPASSRELCVWWAGISLAITVSYPVKISVVTVIETGTETAVFLLNRTEPKPRFYASVLTVWFWNGAALVSWTLQ